MNDSTDLYMIAGIYSDAHKDAYGFRPRQGISPDTTNWTYDDYVAAIKKLEPVIEAEIEREKEEERIAIVEFESTVSQFLSTVSYSTREQAVKYAIRNVETEYTDDDEIKWKLGLPYHYDFRAGKSLLKGKI